MAHDTWSDEERRALWDSINTWCKNRGVDAFGKKDFDRRQAAQDINAACFAQGRGPERKPRMVESQLRVALKRDRKSTKPFSNQPITDLFDRAEKMRQMIESGQRIPNPERYPKEAIPLSQTSAGNAVDNEEEDDVGEDEDLQGDEDRQEDEDLQEDETIQEDEILQQAGYIQEDEDVPEHANLPEYGDIEPDEDRRDYGEPREAGRLDEADEEQSENGLRGYHPGAYRPGKTWYNPWGNLFEELPYQPEGYQQGGYHSGAYQRQGEQLEGEEHGQYEDLEYANYTGAHEDASEDVGRTTDTMAVGNAHRSTEQTSHSGPGEDGREGTHQIGNNGASPSTVWQDLEGMDKPGWLERDLEKPHFK